MPLPQIPSSTASRYGSSAVASVYLRPVAGGSSNGRTLDFDSKNLGSNPSPPAKKLRLSQRKLFDFCPHNCRIDVKHRYAQSTPQSKAFISLSIQKASKTWYAPRVNSPNPRGHYK